MSVFRQRRRGSGATVAAGAGLPRLGGPQTDREHTIRSRTDQGRPEPPYYAAILTTRLSGRDPEGYAEAERRMIALAEQAPGYIGRETARTPDGADRTIVYYEDEAALLAWRDDPEHRRIQRLGREVWYASYEVRIARVERAYTWAAGTSGG